MWREVYGRGIANVDIEPIGGRPVSRRRDLQPAAQCQHRRRLALAGALPGDTGTARRTRPRHHRGQRAAQRQRVRHPIRPGVDRRRRQRQRGGASEPSVSTLHTHGSFITLALSRPAIAELAPNYTAAFGQPIPGQRGAAAPDQISRRRARRRRACRCRRRPLRLRPYPRSGFAGARRARRQCRGRRGSAPRPRGCAR